MSDEVDLQLGRRLRRRRQLLGMSQQELGAACGVRFQQIQKYETAANKMSARMLGRLARALDISVAYFFEGLEPLLAARQPAARRRPGSPDGASEDGPDSAATRP